MKFTEVANKIIFRIRQYLFNLKINLSREKRFRHSTSNGDRFYLYDDEISRSIFIYSGFENINRDYWESLIKPGMNVFDIGANWGIYSVSARRLIGGGGRLYSFEPNKEEYIKLADNLKYNFTNLENVELVNSAVGDVDGTTSFYIPPSHKGAYGSIGQPKIAEDCDKVEVPVLRIDSFIKKAKVEKLDVVKIDVEGAEIKVLKGMEETIKEYKPTILMEVSDKRTEVFGYKAHELCDFLISKGYTLYLPVSRPDGEVVLDEFVPENDIKYVDVVAVMH